MSRRYRSYPSHLYINMITGSLSTPGRGNLSYSKDIDKQSVGHYFSYASINSHLDEEKMCWMVMRRGKLINEFFMTKDQIIERYTRLGKKKANEIEQRINAITQKLTTT